MSSMTKAYMANGNQRLEAYTYTHTTQHTNMAYRQFRKGKTSSIFTVLFFHFFFFVILCIFKSAPPFEATAEVQNYYILGFHGWVRYFFFPSHIHSHFAVLFPSQMWINEGIEQKQQQQRMTKIKKENPSLGRCN